MLMKIQRLRIWVSARGMAEWKVCNRWLSSWAFGTLSKWSNSMNKKIKYCGGGQRTATTLQNLHTWCNSKAPFVLLRQSQYRECMLKFFAWLRVEAKVFFLTQLKPKYWQRTSLPWEFACCMTRNQRKPSICAYCAHLPLPRKYGTSSETG